jgi:hypothetical protein
MLTASIYKGKGATGGIRHRLGCRAGCTLLTAGRRRAREEWERRAGAQPTGLAFTALSRREVLDVAFSCRIEHVRMAVFLE